MVLFLKSNGALASKPPLRLHSAKALLRRFVGSQIPAASHHPAFPGTGPLSHFNRELDQNRGRPLGGPPKPAERASFPAPGSPLARHGRDPILNFARIPDITIRDRKSTRLNTSHSQNS